MTTDSIGGPAAAQVNTRRASRRDLDFDDLDDLPRELDRIEAAAAAGTLTTTGNWTPGQNLEHCAIFMRFAIDGFPFRAPFWIRWPSQIFVKWLVVRGGSPPAGIALRGNLAALRPGDATSFAEGLAELRLQIGRIRAGERFTAPSPLFGRLTHEQWTRIQLGHCTLHLSFLQL